MEEGAGKSEGRGREGSVFSGWIEGRGKKALIFLFCFVFPSGPLQYTLQILYICRSVYLPACLLACLLWTAKPRADLAPNRQGVKFVIGVPKRGAHFMPKSEKWPKKGKDGLQSKSYLLALMGEREDAKIILQLASETSSGTTSHIGRSKAFQCGES